MYFNLQVDELTDICNCGQFIASKSLPFEMNCIMKSVVICVNDIKGEVIDTRICRKIGHGFSVYKPLSYENAPNW